MVYKEQKIIIYLYYYYCELLSRAGTDTTFRPEARHLLGRMTILTYTNDYSIYEIFYSS